jgi:TRAP-type C4-dicarboxylate transport system permease large subunit
MIGNMSTGLILFISIYLPFSSNDENNIAAVHNEIVLIVVDAIGAIRVIVFTLAGTTLGVPTGAIEPAAIHVVVRTFLMTLLVLSTKLLDFFESILDSIELIEFGLLVIWDVLYVVKFLLYE